MDTKLQFNRRQFSIILATSVVFVPVAASASSFDEQINRLRAVVNQQQAESNNLSTQADTPSNKIARIQTQSAALRAQIQLGQARYNEKPYYQIV